MSLPSSEQGGFSAARRAQKTKNFSPAYGKRKIFNNLNGAKGFVDSLATQKVFFQIKILLLLKFTQSPFH